jgi:hypothetical protein
VRHGRGNRVQGMRMTMRRRGTMMRKRRKRERSDGR